MDFMTLEILKYIVDGLYESHGPDVPVFLLGEYGEHGSRSLYNITGFSVGKEDEDSPANSVAILTDYKFPKKEN